MRQRANHSGEHPLRGSFGRDVPQEAVRNNVRGLLFFLLLKWAYKSGSNAGWDSVWASRVSDVRSTYNCLPGGLDGPFRLNVGHGERRCGRPNPRHQLAIEGIASTGWRSLLCE